MRFFATASAVLAMATSALAQTADFNPVYTPKKGEVVPAGSTFEVTWSAPPKYKDGTVSISLIGGADPNSLVPLQDVASGIANADESYQWAVDASLGDEATYGLVFTLESNPDIFQYSLPFKIKGGKGKGGNGKPTHTITTATGIKTVTLTSCPPTTTSTSTPITTSTFAPNTTTTWSTTKHWNTTSTHISTPLPPPATSTDLGTPEPSVPAPEPTPTEPPTAGGAHLVAGPVALVGGLAMALLAL